MSIEVMRSETALGSTSSPAPVKPPQPVMHAQTWARSLGCFDHRRCRTRRRGGAHGRRGRLTGVRSRRGAGRRSRRASRIDVSHHLRCSAVGVRPEPPPPPEPRVMSMPWPLCWSRSCRGRQDSRAWIRRLCDRSDRRGKGRCRRGRWCSGVRGRRLSCWWNAGRSRRSCGLRCRGCGGHRRRFSECRSNRRRLGRSCRDGNHRCF